MNFPLNKKPDSDESDKTNFIDTEIQQAPAEAVAVVAPVDEELVHHFTSLPVATYHLGRFQFTNGYLSLNAADGQEFIELVGTQPVTEQVRIKKLPGAPIGANAGVSMVQGIDHTGNVPTAPVPASA